MIRYFLARGDRAGSATIVEGLPSITCSNPPPAVQIATLYMKTYCTACKREGFIAPEGPRHAGTGPNGKPWALSGDINVCGCHPAPVFYAERAMKMSFTSEEVARTSAPIAPAYVPQREYTHEEHAHEKVSEEEPSTLEDHPDLICPNMTNEEFARMVMKRRDKAVSLIDKRMTELTGWSPATQARVAQWFGNSDSTTRDYLAAGLSRIRHVLAGLTPGNFVRYSEAAMANVGCVSDSKKKLGVVAEVCAPDTATHTIAIHLDFCELRDFSYSMDSQVSTLIHEVSHFHDTMSTGDPVYFMRKCRELAKSKPEITLHNADSIAGYVIYED
ncbi:M35 family metallo-endopeptidase [Ralstonia sp. R-29]|uniref:M35 family metallo-endopeptidase n=1 Tax=Ralstonia sp. R-29 TaxID=3404059 RepID=UPI003CFABEA9